MSDIDLSFVVVAYAMERELPRTLYTLGHQTEIDPSRVEVIVVDNGSPTPIDPSVVDDFEHGQVIRIDPAPSSPVKAANTGLAEARGAMVGLLIDGARMLSPGVADRVMQAARLGDRTVIATLAFHLGEQPQMVAVTEGYDQAVEDQLLASVDWKGNGYHLFEISTLAGSSTRGWFGPMGECNALFMPRALWNELGGLDEQFDLAGGGLANHDLYRRSCSLTDVELVVILGEGSFHQFHGGATTGGGGDREPWHQYERLRGEAFSVPQNQPLYVGRLPDEALGALHRSAEWARRNR